MKEDILKKLEEMFKNAQELASLQDPQLEGDIQIIVGLLADKLRCLKPEVYYKHVI